MGNIDNVIDYLLLYFVIIYLIGKFIRRLSTSKYIFVDD